MGREFAIPFDNVQQLFAIGPDMLRKRLRLFGDITGHDAEAFHHFGPTKADE